jgi:hypothetical protein
MSNRDEIEFMTTNFSAVNNNLLICRGTCLSDKRNEAVISDNKQLDKGIKRMVGLVIGTW